MAGTLLGYPLDTIKTRMQAESGALARRVPALPLAVTSSPLPLGVVGTARLMAREDGARAFYRGIGSPMLALTVLNTFCFATYAQSRALLRVSDERIAGGVEPRVLLAGASVGFYSGFISTPFELVKCQMQLERARLVNAAAGTTATPYRSSLHAAMHIARTHGALALWRGFAVNTLRESIFLGVYFFMYEHAKSSFTSLLVDRWRAVDSPSAAIAVAGGLSGACAWFVSFPLDCIKSVIQGRPFTGANDGSSGTRSSAWRVARDLYAARGVSAFYAGVLPSIARAFLVSGTRFSAYEGTLAALREHSVLGARK